MSHPHAPGPPSRHPVWRAIKIGAGGLLLVLGIAGLFLPILQGILLLAAGLGLLSTEIPWIRRLRLRWIDRFRDRKRRRRDAGMRAVTALAVAGLWLSAAACLTPHAQGSGIREKREIPVWVTIESRPAGALVTDLTTGEVLGTTPLRVRALTLQYEDWVVVNDPGATGRLLEESSRKEGGYALAGGRPGEDPEESLAPPLRLRYRLDLEGHLSLVLSREIDPRTLPLLEKNPEIALSGDLALR